jgi:hypothetical protein
MLSSLFQLYSNVFYHSYRIILFLSFFLIQNTKAQKNNTTTNLIWYDIVLHFPISVNWNAYGEFGQRRINLIEDLNQQIFRVGIIRNISSDLKITFGLATFQNDMNPSFSFKNRPEYRVFQFIEIAKQLGKVQTEFRLRIEQRWNQNTNGTELLDEFTFSHRIGYRFKGRFTIPAFLKSNNRYYLEIGNETMVQFGKKVDVNTFDQIRLFSGLGVKWSQIVSSQFTFMYLFQQKSNGVNFAEQYIFRLSNKIVL